MKWICLILLLLLLSNMGNPWVQFILFVIIIVLIVRFIKSLKKNKKKDKEFLDGVEKGDITYKHAYYFGNEIYSINFETYIESLKKVLIKIQNFATEYESHESQLKDGEIYKYNYPIFKSSAANNGIFVPFDYTDKSYDARNTKMLNKDLKWIHEVSQKEFTEMKMDDVRNIFRWYGKINVDKIYVSDSKGQEIYILKLKDKHKKMSRANYHDIKRLDENFEDYIDMFGSNITFR